IRHINGTLMATASINYKGTSYVVIAPSVNIKMSVEYAMRGDFETPTNHFGAKIYTTGTYYAYQVTYSHPESTAEAVIFASMSEAERRRFIAATAEERRLLVNAQYCDGTRYRVGLRQPGAESSQNLEMAPSPKTPYEKAMELFPNNGAELAVLFGMTSFYRGALVFWQEWDATKGGSFSIGAIFLNKGESLVDIDMSKYTDYAFKNLVQRAIWLVMHEFGHSVQLALLGPAAYAYLAARSLHGSTLGLLENDYYNQPWEIIADLFGGVSRPSHTEEARKAGWEWWNELFLLSKGIIIL
ncbi:MAG: hypothetical protein FWH32_04005, partial [Clostridiales bacterium]|nr:hypothetical protein [Clostridiales bacterium]